MTNYEFWLMFLTAAIALNIAPGPDLMYILTKTVAGGRKVGWAAAMGVCSGALFHVAIASVGLSAIIFHSAVAFTLVKYVGAVYLLYLAWQSFKSSGTGFNIDNTQKNKETPWQAYKQGVLIDILNPKVALFFMAFLPQFIRDGYGSVGWQTFYLGILVILVAVVVETIYVLMADKLTGKLRNSRQFSIWLDRVVGGVFVALATKLALSSRS